MSQARLEGPVPGNPFSILGRFDLDAAGYVGEEWLASGDAHRYSLEARGAERSEDGRWPATRGDAAPFVTRILVRRPADPARFDGTLVVEWMNVSGGIDAAPDWLFLHRHLMREGSAWVGVSAQKAGIDGGGLVPGMPLKQADPDRYGGLVHPGDAYAFDVFTQIGRALRQAGSGPLGDLDVQRVIAVGESQSAGFLVTYVNAVDPLERCFDAFLVHGRPGMAAGLDGQYMRAARTNEELSQKVESMTAGHRIRDDVRVPVIVVQSETDVVLLRGGLARQPDAERLRLWEIAGAAHFDTYGLIASQMDEVGVTTEDLAHHMRPTDKPMGIPAESPVNSGPQQHYVLNAALAHLVRWVRTGTPAPSAPRLETTDAQATALVRDDLGLARGGIRTPWVEAPTALLSGDPPGGDGFIFLFGTTRPFDDATLARLYPGGHAEHVRRFDEATARAVDQGFLLDADAEEIRALARHGRQPSGWRHG